MVSAALLDIRNPLLVERVMNFLGDSVMGYWSDGVMGERQVLG
jgi:hypothetical protein